MAINVTDDPGEMEVTFVGPVADSTTAMAGNKAATGGALAELEVAGCGDVVAVTRAVLDSRRASDGDDDPDKVVLGVRVADIDGV